MIDRDDLLATMYDDESVATVPIDRNDPHVRKIRVGVVEYEVPTLEYIRQLEQLLTQQSHRLHQQQRAINRIVAMLHGTRGHVRQHGGAIGELRSDLTRKVDHV